MPVITFIPWNFHEHFPCQEGGQQAPGEEYRNTPYYLPYSFTPYRPVVMERPRNPIVQQKAAFRERFLAFRKALSPADHVTRSAALVARMKTLPELLGAETVHLYWPLLDRREVDLGPLIDWLQASGKQIVLPVVDTFTGAPRLRHVRFEASMTLQVNQWGIHEPLGGKSVPLEYIDVVVVPALGAGRNGHRIGYGKGYYDAFLRTIDAPTLCPIYRECLAAYIPAEAHDVALDVLITEDEIIRPRSGVTSSLLPS